MFAPRLALDACRSFFIQQGIDINVLRLPTTVAAFLDFYRDERAEGCALDDDADMLLFEWGTFDWGDGEHFELNLARQFIIGGDDEDIWQLKLTYAYEPTDAFRALGSESRWCETPEEIDAFRQDVERSAAYAAALDVAEIGIVSIGYFRAG